MLRKIWKDPVGSKLIAAALIGLTSLIYSGVEVIITDLTFVESLQSFWNFELPAWILLILILITILIIQRIHKKSAKKLHEANEDVEEIDPDVLEIDRKLFNEIRSDVLPQNGSISFIRTNNFAGHSFDLDNLDDLYTFRDLNKNSDFEFLTPELETIKEELFAKIEEFTSLIALKTFPTHIGRQTVPPEWELEQPERFIETVNAIHKSATDICNHYDNLVRSGRKQLKVS